MDETYIGGEEPGLRGGRGKGKKALTGIAVEAGPKGFGRCRMAPLADASAESLNPFLTGHRAGRTVITDGWQGYCGLEDLGYTHEPQPARRPGPRRDPTELLPGRAHVSSLAKRWLLGTHQGSVDEAHLAAYLNEFVFRFNRRRSRSRGLVFYRLLELATGHDPVRFQDLLAGKKPSPHRQRGAWATRQAWTGQRRTGHGEQANSSLQLPIPLRLSKYPRAEK